MTPQGDLVFTDFSHGGLVVHILTAACHLCVLMYTLEHLLCVCTPPMHSPLQSHRRIAFFNDAKRLIKKTHASTRWIACQQQLLYNSQKTFIPNQELHDL